jgi:hypothetical protein
LPVLPTQTGGVFLRVHYAGNALINPGEILTSGYLFDTLLFERGLP